ncbi:MAG: lysostaphin resistance A-like protein [Bavariicoccus seileri]|uniref:CPBP family intramembrane glutamic endopeptidase n=1 Tax=Bavariicoccus seileri TaxID=549685 RepID=UPI0003B4AEEF|nr:CPBP family intramembrane glutamic endopeptidase [Bavariicoccus seileri]
MERVSKRTRLLYTVVFWIGLLVVPIVAGIISQYYAALGRHLEIISIISSLTSAVIGVYLFRDLIRRDYRYLEDKWVKVTLLIIAGFVFRIVLTTLLTQLVSVETSENQVALEGMLNTIPLWLFSTMIVASAPITEELFFREVLLGWTKSRLVQWVMGIVSVLFFSFMHTTTDPLSVVLYIPIAIPIVFLYFYFRKNVVVSIIFHVVNNAIALAAMVVTSKG